DGRQQVSAMMNLKTGVEQLLTIPTLMSGSEMMAPFDWSGDGTEVLGSCSSAARPLIGICLFSTAPHGSNATGPSVPRLLASRSNAQLYEAQFSPDGRWICFNAVSSGQSTIYAAPVEGG